MSYMFKNIQGFGWSGGSFIRDLMAESFDITVVPIEFGLLTDNKGILDTYDKIWNNPNHINGYFQLNEFRTACRYWSERLDSRPGVNTDFFSFLREAGVLDDFPLSTRLNLSSRISLLDRRLYTILRKLGKPPGRAFDINCSESQFRTLCLRWFEDVFDAFSERTYFQKLIPIGNINQFVHTFPDTQFQTIIVDRSWLDSFNDMYLDKGLFLNDCDIQVGADRYIRYRERLDEHSKFLNKSHGATTKIGNFEALYLTFEDSLLDVHKTVDVIANFTKLKKGNVKLESWENSRKNIGSGLLLPASIQEKFNK